MIKAELEMPIHHQKYRRQVRSIDRTDVNAQNVWLQFRHLAAKSTEVSTKFMKKLYSNITQKRSWAQE